MSDHEKDSSDCLFSRYYKKLINIKFMRGTAENISPEDLRAEVCGIVARRDGGLQPSGAIKSGKLLIDICKLVAEM